MASRPPFPLLSQIAKKFFFNDEGHLKDILSLTLTLGWKNEKQPSGPIELDLEAGNLVIIINILLLYYILWGIVPREAGYYGRKIHTYIIIIPIHFAYQLLSTNIFMLKCILHTNFCTLYSICMHHLKLENILVNWFDSIFKKYLLKFVLL